MDNPTYVSSPSTNANDHPVYFDINEDGPTFTVVDDDRAPLTTHMVVDVNHQDKKLRARPSDVKYFTSENDYEELSKI